MKWHNMRSIMASFFRKENGFTIIELLVIGGIVAMMGSVATVASVQVIKGTREAQSTATDTRAGAQKAATYTQNQAGKVRNYDTSNPANTDLSTIVGAYFLTVNVEGKGTVERSPKQGSYDNGVIVTLTAVPSRGWSFAGWTGTTNNGINPGTITINGQTTAGVRFTQNTYTLTTSVAGTGTITVNPPNGPYHYGDVVTLTATAGNDFVFAGWGGDLAGSGNTPSVSLTIGDHDSNVIANFTNSPYYITTTISGNGHITMEPGGPIYQSITTVNLTAVPDPGWKFAGWGGAISGSVATATITVDGPKTVSANFTELPSIYDYAIIALNGNINLTGTSSSKSSTNDDNDDNDNDEDHHHNDNDDNDDNDDHDGDDDDHNNNDNDEYNYGGNIYAAGNIYLNGSVDIYGDATATGTISKSGNARVYGVQTAQFTPPLVFAPVYTAAYLTQADSAALTAAQYDTYKAQAQAGGTVSGSYNKDSDHNYTLGSKYITGDMNISGSAIVTVTGTVWVNGSITVEGSAELKGSGVIIGAVSSSSKSIVVKEHADLRAVNGVLVVIAKLGSFSATSDGTVSARVYAPNGNITITSDSDYTLPQQHITGNLVIKGNGGAAINDNETVWVGGTIIMSGNSHLKGTGTLVAVGDITLNGSSTPDTGDLTFVVSTTGKITINGNGNISAIIYAPNGQVQMGNGSVYGSVIGKSVTSNGSNNIRYPVAKQEHEHEDHDDQEEHEREEDHHD